MRPPASIRLDLARDFVFDRLLDETERIEILDFSPGAVFGRSLGPHRDVNVAAQVAFLHLAVRGIDVAQDVAQLAQVGAGLFGRSDIGLADDLDQRHAESD